VFQADGEHKSGNLLSQKAVVSTFFLETLVAVVGGVIVVVVMVVIVSACGAVSGSGSELLHEASGDCELRGQVGGEKEPTLMK